MLVNKCLREKAGQKKVDAAVKAITCPVDYDKCLLQENKFAAHTWPYQVTLQLILSKYFLFVTTRNLHPTDFGIGLEIASHRSRH